MTEQEKSNSFSAQPVPPPAVKENGTKENHAVPEYLKSVYGRRYFHPFFSKLFDDEWTAAAGSFFYGRKLIKSVVSEIMEGNDVLQLGVASGNFEREIALKMNSKGHYDIEDISPQHIEAFKPRVSAWLNIAVRERDFTIPNERRYDAVIGYFVLHEVPDIRKHAILKRAFNALKPNGKMIFVDYAQPKKFHPLKYPVKMFNRLYEPFAESLWYNEIESFAPKTDKLIWDKKLFFGNLYQCVIAQRC
ncbi:MAG: rhodoquinone biosynthesis methyltransferase RquA [Alphaproteobacteria bacterium]|nr:rhodoquinone biosynthesis methyltransferase RquA [Alphaproteobacteria bacterium]